MLMNDITKQYLFLINCIFCKQRQTMYYFKQVPKYINETPE